jgi:hypothetical protein
MSPNMGFTLFCVLVILLLILCMTLYLQNKQINDIIREPIPQVVDTIESMHSKEAPRVYEIIYIKRDPTDMDKWLISRQHDVSRRFVEDLRSNMINHAVVNGNLYAISYVKLDEQYHYIQFKRQCNNVKWFSHCDVTDIQSNNESLILHVLGYHFTSSQ